MDFTGGGGLMLAMAAGLWLVYLVPNWLRRKEFDATERNAVRLQQTMRVLAETAEGPVAPARRLSEAALAAPVAPVAPSAAMRREAALSSARRIRRSRALASLALLTAVVIMGVQFSVAMATGWSSGGLLVLGIGGVLGFCAVALLRRLASVRPVAASAAPRTVRTTVPDIELPAEPVVREWTPVPVPRPIARPAVAPSTMADPRIAAAAAQEQRQRAARGADREVATLPPAVPAAPAAARSRFAAMGVVDEQAGSALSDLDAVLARRRA